MAEIYAATVAQDAPADKPFDFEDEGDLGQALMDSLEVDSDVPDGTDDDAPVDDDEVSPTEGEAEVVEGDDEAEAEPEPDKYTVKVNGVESEVTLDELLGGYQRNQDYTQKTQELAAQRQQVEAWNALQAGLEGDPSTVVLALAKHYGVELASSTPPAVEDEFADPLEQKIAQLQRELAADRQANAQREAAQAAQQNQARLAAAADAEADAVKVNNNRPDLDGRVLMQFAIDNGLGNLQIAYEVMQGRGLLDPPTPPAPTKAATAKADLPPVEGGKSRPRATTAPPAPKSFSEALKQTMRGL